MNEKRINIPARLVFSDLAKPVQFQGQGAFRYTAALAVDLPSKAAEKIEAAILAAAEAKWPGKGASAVASFRKTNKLPIQSDLDRAFEGKLRLSAAAKSTAPPALVITRNGKNETLDRATQTAIYDGCYVNVIVEFWAQDNQFGKRINAQLCGVQFVSDGDPIGSSSAAGADEFEEVEAAPGGDDDFGTEFA